MMTIEEALDERGEVEHLIRMHRLLVHGADSLPREWNCQRCVGLANRHRVLKTLTFAHLYSAGSSAHSAQGGR